MKLFLTTLLCVVSMCCFSQNEGYVIIGQDQRIEELIQKQKEIHSIDNTIDGFRVQIFMESGNDAVEHANAVMEEFKANYPDIPIYLVFGQPYYRLRVGDFRTRLEAEKMFQTLSQEYKKAFVTSDRIQLPYNIFSDTSLDVNLEDIDNDLDTIQNDTIISTDNIYYQY
jgi:hypothetical protein